MLSKSLISSIDYSFDAAVSCQCKEENSKKDSAIYV